MIYSPVASWTTSSMVPMRISHHTGSSNGISFIFSKSTGLSVATLYAKVISCHSGSATWVIVWTACPKNNGLISCVDKDFLGLVFE